MDSQVKAKFETYPEPAKAQLLKIRATIFQVADDESLGDLTEALKWNEPSYQSKNGSPVRIDWKEKSPDTISVYLNCKTQLIETFKEIYRDSFCFVGNREIVFSITEELPIDELRVCFSMALRYHKIKHLPLLGA